MKREIYGVVYDTDKSKLIADTEFGEPGDYRHVYEAFYRDIDGDYFLYAVGGAGTGYRRYVDATTMTEGHRIRPLDRADALSWCEANHVDPDIIEREFATLAK